MVGWTRAHLLKHNEAKRRADDRDIDRPSGAYKKELITSVACAPATKPIGEAQRRTIKITVCLFVVAAAAAAANDYYDVLALAGAQVYR